MSIHDKHTVPPDQWEWLGTKGHFICADRCQWSMYTIVGGVGVSSIGEMVEDSNRPGRYSEIGLDRKYETMVFPVESQCTDRDCKCGGEPLLDYSRELDMRGYNDRASATAGHMDVCRYWASRGGSVPSQDDPFEGLG